MALATPACGCSARFRFDIVKIDLSLVQEGAERDSSRAVLRSLRDLAGSWGASVIAEGLETVSQLRTVRELGIAAGQGYLLGRPTADTTLARSIWRQSRPAGWCSSGARSCRRCERFARRSRADASLRRPSSADH